MDYHAQRREQLTKFVAAAGVDGLMVTSPVNVTYLTGFSGDSSYLLVGRDRVLLVSDGRFEVQLKEECPGLPVHIRPPAIRITPAAILCLEKLGWRTIGYESGHLTVAEYDKFRASLPAATWKPCEDFVERLRVRKDPSEIAAIREAIDIAERAFDRWRQSLRPEDTEKQLGDRMEMLIRAEGGTCCCFPTIVGVGMRASLPHAPLTATPLSAGDFVLLDWGSSGRFYKSDLTRVLATRKISPKLEQVHAAVLKAQQRAIAKIRPGIQALEVDAEARAVLNEAGFGNFFSHGLGHGLGLEVHEAPGLRQGSETILEAGMVVTVEPGVYLNDWGGVRIEDDVLVTPDGYEVLTHLSRGLELGFTI